ncbi:MAG TPA: hypothetical protein PK640_13710 [Verrucomicrobiota bacterium]|nr:hypothetical protein [Verrucomicrobiota bacterium]
MSAAAVIIRRRKRLVRRFAEEGALSSDQAIPFSKVGMRRSWIFEQMVSRGVFVGVGEDRYYMNEQAARAFLAAQRRRVLTVAGTLLVVSVIVVILLCAFGW